MRRYCPVRCPNPARARLLLAAALALVVGVLGPGASVAPAAADQPFATQLVRVAVPTQQDRDRLTALGLDLTEHGGPTYVEVVLHRLEDAGRLATAGFTWTVTIPDLALRQRHNNEVSTAYAAAVTTSPLPSGRDTYRTLRDYEQELRTLAASNPALIRLFSLEHRSLEGREILGIEIPRNVTS